MKIQSRQWFLVYAGVSTLALAGCSDEERPGSSVSGGRRAPILNEEMMAAMPAKAATRADAPPPTSLAAKNAKIASQDNPYDAYDSSGNKKSSGSSARASAEGDKDVGLLDGYFGHDDARTVEDRPVRKPISGNNYVQSAAAPVATTTVVEPPAPASLPPLSSKDRVVDKSPHMLQLPKSASELPAPQPQLKPQVQSQMEAPQPVVAPAPTPQAQAVETTTTTTTTQTTTTETSEAPKHTGLIGHVADYVTGPKDEAAEKEADQAKYIPLSTVPQKPARLDVIKQENPQKLKDMQAEGASAAQQKQALDSEATDDGSQQAQAPDAPVEEQTKQVATPAPQPQLQPAAAEPVAAPAAMAASNLPSSDILKQKKAATSAN